MRGLVAVFIVLFTLLQYQLWFGTYGVAQTLRVKYSIDHQLTVNQQEQIHNQKTVKQIHKLKTNPEAVEALARQDLGMIKSNETYYQFVK